MAAAYDNFDYPTYWEGRFYEHTCETIALKALLSRISKIDRLIEIGGGYGRLLPTYAYRARRIVFTDPSAKLLSIARVQTKGLHIKFIQTKAENLRKKVKPSTFDLVLCVRVLHHIEDIDELFDISFSLLKKGGYFILEFPNKRHFKAVFSEFLRGNFTFYSDIFPKDLSSDKEDGLPFVNYHPDEVEKKLKENGFKIISTRSVSNIRSSFMKRYFPVELVLSIEKRLQKPLSSIRFGPSIFILAQKQ